jgi:hypothetical protein
MVVFFWHLYKDLERLTLIPMRISRLFRFRTSTWTYEGWQGQCINRVRDGRPCEICRLDPQKGGGSCFWSWATRPTPCTCSTKRLEPALAPTHVLGVGIFLGCILDSRCYRVVLRPWSLVLSLTLLAGCTHDLAALRASTPEVMQEVAAPYDDLSKCTKQQSENSKQTHLSLSEHPRTGVNRLAMLTVRRDFLFRQHQDAVFEFTFVRQSPRSTLIEFRNAGSTTHSDIAWNAIAECSRRIISEFAPSRELEKLIE